jgi:hypothetical protein
MEPTEAVVASLAVFMSCITVIALVGTWLKHRKNVGVEALARFENRLARLEVALDDVTAELGRMTESHQTLAKSLADRQALPR